MSKSSDHAYSQHPWCLQVVCADNGDHVFTENKSVSLERK